MNRSVRFLVFLVMLIPMSAFAVTRYVDDTGGVDAGDCTNSGTPCLTINYAISQAVGGDVVQVAAGAYPEGGNPIQVNKALTISGANAGVSACGARGAESIVSQTFAILVDGVMIDGFTVTCAACVTYAGVGVHTNNTISGYQILNNEITGNTVGIALASSGTTAAVVQGNDISANNAAGGGSGNGIYNDTSGSNVTINDNCFTGNLNSDLTLFGVVGPFVNIDVADNTFTNTDVGGSTVLLYQNVDSSSFTGNTVLANDGSQIYLAASNDDFLIDGNHFTGGTDRAAITIDFYDIASTGTAALNGLITITGNVIRNNARALKLYSGASVTVEMHCNVIEDHSVADIETDTTFTPVTLGVNAEDNWWGCNEGPSVCATFNRIGSQTTPIDADPWIVMDISASAIDPWTSTVTADFNQNSDGEVLTNCFPDGEVVTFTAMGGTVDPTSAPTIGGAATTTFSRIPPAGAASVSATLDDETVTIDLAFLQPIPALSPLMLTMLAMLLAGAALVVTRR